MFKEMKMRQLQKRANAFVNSLEGKSDKEVEQAYLDNKEFTNNEIVLSFLFFKHPSLIRILPIDFQKSRINSNLSMFRSGSNEARKSLVSDWIKDNKFFMNATSIGMDDEEYNNYLKIYFDLLFHQVLPIYYYQLTYDLYQIFLFFFLFHRR